MGLFFRKSKDKTAIQKLHKKLQQISIKQKFYLNAIQTMLHFLKEFAIDHSEINTDGYKRQIDLLRKKFDEDHEVEKPMITLFKQSKETILGFINEQMGYIKDRDREFREIIDIMSKALAAQNDENRQFNRSINKRSDKIERITHLDDLRKIRSALEQEIDQLRRDVINKQAMEEERMKALGQEINSLSRELKMAKQEALTDSLTGLSNRKAFDQYIADLSTRSAMGNGAFALLLLDIDDFKKINDTYGHQTGDTILEKIAGKCRETTRSNDFIGRYGGEEFAVILPSSSLRNAVKRGRQIKKSIAATHYKHKYENTDTGITLRVTVSIGVSVFRKGDTFSMVIERADKALYAAKEAGKNRVVSEKEID
jgi:diguanylate cyclase